MLKNFVQPERVKTVWYELNFWYKDDPGAGFGFPCNERGEILADEMTKEAVENYEWCMAHPERFGTFNHLSTRVDYYKPNAHGTCVCGEEVELYDQYMGACECPKCGRWYNLFGQSLLPPDQWENEEYAY